MKIESTNLPLNQRPIIVKEETTPHKTMEYAFLVALSVNSERIHHCSVHPEDLTFDFFIALMMEQYEANRDIPESTYQSIEEQLRTTFVPKMLDKRLNDRMASDQRLLKLLKDIDWDALLKMKLTALTRDEDVLLSKLHIGRLMGGFERAMIPGFIMALCKVLSELVDTLPEKEGPLELSIDDLIPYVKYKMISSMRFEYIDYEHVYDEVLGDYTSHMLPRVAEIKKVEISIIDGRSASV